MKKTMIFHHPLPVKPDGNSGSQVRPFKMAKAFENIGYEVEMVTGYGAERKKAIKKIKADFRKGRKFDFIYSESSTMPTLLTETHHLPIYPFLDFSFFSWAKKRGIPIGLFYRDIHWKYETYKKEVSLYKRIISIPMYWYDLFAYKRLVDYLYLPSLRMKSVLPINWDNSKVTSLPPGGEFFKEKLACDYKHENMIKMIYVGGIKPPLYDLVPMFEVMQLLSEIVNIELVLCCRKEEWQSEEALYKPLLTKNVKIVHYSGAE
ncbi:putative glycosyl transferase [Thermovirga lienii DSM 17291]|uniref:Putative glycosyl transferase n=1 Tax=Thermovirga lienii (strain ATCC BAA-1197 / DSM 17291 / Cas60314) TaxID=580340 RepID=G7V8Z8_THELD|nr:hypothetical protein [Thermovirga lienii]AER67532.1 putative glycosyl transferase [Thermovirga lienii DSM 17291]